MNRFHRRSGCRLPNRLQLHLSCWTVVAALQNHCSMAEPQTNIQAWVARAEWPPAFQPGPAKSDWERQRRKIRAEVWELLGKLPPRAMVPKVEIISRSDKEDYVLEKFQFDNQAGSTVPGYVFLPKASSGK